MNRIPCLVLAVLLFVLSGCSTPQPHNQTNNFYTFDHTGIVEITATSQMSENVNNIVVSEENIEALLNKLDSLCLTPVDDGKKFKGWQYLFVIEYDDGNIIKISLSEEQVNINGQIYTTTLYHSDDFLTYFN